MKKLIIAIGLALQMSALCFGQGVFGKSLDQEGAKVEDKSSSVQDAEIPHKNKGDFSLETFDLDKTVWVCDKAEAAVFEFKNGKMYSNYRIESVYSYEKEDNYIVVKDLSGNSWIFHFTLDGRMIRDDGAETRIMISGESEVFKDFLEIKGRYDAVFASALKKNEDQVKKILENASKRLERDGDFVFSEQVAKIIIEIEFGGLPRFGPLGGSVGKNASIKSDCDKALANRNALAKKIFLENSKKAIKDYERLIKRAASEGKKEEARAIQYYLNSLQQVIRYA